MGTWLRVDRPGASLRRRLLALWAGTVVAALGITAATLTAIFERHLERRVAQELAVRLHELAAAFVEEDGAPALAGKLEALASNPRLPARWLKKLELAGNTPVLKALAANPSASPQTLEWLAGDFRDGVAAVAVAHPNCPPDVLATMASDLAVPDDVRRAAAANPNCPPLPRVVGGLLAD